MRSVEDASCYLTICLDRYDTGLIISMEKIKLDAHGFLQDKP